MVLKFLYVVGRDFIAEQDQKSGGVSRINGANSSSLSVHIKVPGL
jgi:hypothetical protein